MAHAADALDDLAQAIELEKEDLQMILELVRSKITVQDRVFTDEEDERMVTAVISVWRRNQVTVEEMNDWVRSFANIEGTGYELRIRQNNAKNFLRSLYFRVKFLGIDGLDRLPVEEALQTLGKRFYA